MFWFGAVGCRRFPRPTVMEAACSATLASSSLAAPLMCASAFYAISMDAKLKHPAVVAVCEGARKDAIGLTARPSSPPGVIDLPVTRAEPTALVSLVGSWTLSSRRRG
jgi:hypothetical protein